MVCNSCPTSGPPCPQSTRATSTSNGRLSLAAPLRAAGLLLSALALADVRFAYPNAAPVLDGITLAIAHGEMVGILGPSRPAGGGDPCFGELERTSTVGGIRHDKGSRAGSWGVADRGRPGRFAHRLRTRSPGHRRTSPDKTLLRRFRLGA